jgi:hypothetical protein
MHASHSHPARAVWVGLDLAPVVESCVEKRVQRAHRAAASISAHAAAEPARRGAIVNATSQYL